MILILTLMTLIAQAGGPHDIGYAEVFADLTTGPGYPEDVVYDEANDRLFVTMPATFGTAGSGPSQVQVLDSETGALLDAIDLQGENLNFEHALSGAALNWNGDLVVLSTQLGAVVISDAGNGIWSQQACGGPFPDLNLNDPLPPLPNGIAVTGNNDYLVTDSLQNVIWRVDDDCSSAPEIWFEDPSSLYLTGSAQMGLNGIRLHPWDNHIYFAFTGGPGVAPGEIDQPGRIYRLPDVENPYPSDLELVYSYSAFDMTDGIAFDIFGRLWSTLALSNAISRIDGLNQCGVTPYEDLRITQISGPGASVGLKAPANIAFTKPGHLKVVNHALFEQNFDPNPFVVFDVYVGPAVIGASLP